MFLTRPTGTHEFNAPFRGWLNQLWDWIKGSSGTWTPVLTFATPGDLNVVYSTQNGQFLKIGQTVFIDFEIATSTFTHTTASGNCRITGLPFIAKVGAGAFRTNLQWGGITKAGYTHILGAINNGATTVTFQASGSGVAPSNVVAADMPTTGSVVLRCTGFYFVE